ncbi:Sec-independent protein translocase subunit TatA [Corynebacterium mayonis]|uniref:Sec-independent protein translocase subunit TatA n=1 Tax=Corynebacterium mayonis TaxID=3062461 RepID=UPI0031402A1C
MPNLGWTEILIILVIILLLFGANKLPDLARSMGRSARIFKSEVKEMSKDDQLDLPPALNQETGSVAQPQDHFGNGPKNQPHPQN